MALHESLPTRGVRVEILLRAAMTGAGRSLPTRGVRVEISRPPSPLRSSPSLPTRGVRVEIDYTLAWRDWYPVTPHKGSAG